MNARVRFVIGLCAPTLQGMRFALVVLASTLCAVVVACGEAKPQGARSSRQERVLAAEHAVGQTPVPRVYRVDGNQLLVLDFPVKDAAGFLDRQRCFVWRDAEFRTATLSCTPGEPAALLDKLGD